MSHSSGVNKVFLLGAIENEPEWHDINQQQVLCFQLITTEYIKKDGAAQKHSEWHNIKIPRELTRDVPGLDPGDLVYVHGKLQTRIVFENKVKLYKTEVLAMSFEKLKFSHDIVEVP